MPRVGTYHRPLVATLIVHKACAAWGRVTVVGRGGVSRKVRPLVVRIVKMFFVWPMIVHPIFFGHVKRWWQGSFYVVFVPLVVGLMTSCSRAKGCSMGLNLPLLVKLHVDVGHRWSKSVLCTVFPLVACWSCVGVF